MREDQKTPTKHKPTKKTHIYLETNPENRVALSPDTNYE